MRGFLPARSLKNGDTGNNPLLKHAVSTAAVQDGLKDGLPTNDQLGKIHIRNVEQTADQNIRGRRLLFAAARIIVPLSCCCWLAGRILCLARRLSSRPTWRWCSCVGVDIAIALDLGFGFFLLIHREAEKQLPVFDSTGKGSKHLSLSCLPASGPQQRYRCFGDGNGAGE